VSVGGCPAVGKIFTQNLRLEWFEVMGEKLFIDLNTLARIVPHTSVVSFADMQPNLK